MLLVSRAIARVNNQMRQRLGQGRLSLSKISYMSWGRMCMLHCIACNQFSLGYRQAVPYYKVCLNRRGKVEEKKDLEIWVKVTSHLPQLCLKLKCCLDHGCPWIVISSALKVLFFPSLELPWLIIFSRRHYHLILIVFKSLCHRTVASVSHVN